MCERERQHLRSKKFYAECTRGGQFEMNVCIVELENIEELRRWLKDPTELSKLILEVRQQLAAAEAELSTIGAAVAYREKDIEKQIEVYEKSAEQAAKEAENDTRV